MDHSTSPYTIAFFTTGSDLEYSSLVTKALSKVAKKQNVNIINILGGSLNPNFSFSKYKYQYQSNVIFDYAHTPHIDGIILGSGTLASFIDSAEFEDFYAKFKPTPMVSLGINIDGLPSVYTNNTEIYTELVSHIIKVHHKTKIAFIAGPSNNIDSMERFAGYINALFLNNIPYRPELVYMGDFTPHSGKEAIVNFFDEKNLEIEAIVCANDAGAQTAINELKARHYSIPEDILVTGCDNVPSGAYCVPSLTTISQSMEQCMEESLHLLLKLIQNKPVQNVIVPGTIHFRESCPSKPIDQLVEHEPSILLSHSKTNALIKGFLELCSKTMTVSAIEAIASFFSICYGVTTHSIDPDTIEVDPSVALLAELKKQQIPINIVLQMRDYIFLIQKELYNLAIDLPTIQYVDTSFLSLQRFIITCLLDCHDRDSLHMQRNFSYIRQFLLTITHNISDRTKQLQSIIPSLMNCGIHTCLIYLYPSEIIHNLSDPWVMPEEINLYMGFIDGKVIPPSQLPKTIKCEDLLTYELNNRSEKYITYVHPIFFGNEQLGVCIFELNFDNYTLIENITVELACALKLSSTFNVQRQTENKLATLSQTDELTSLLNRRGFFNLAQDKFIFSLASHKNGILFYADMDGLKKINDTYGHEEGDYAIISMANILKTAFSKTGILGRIGGDEFVILCTGQVAEYINEVTKEINRLCKIHNDESGKPYLLSISVGGIAYESTTTETLESLLSKADKLLYREKRFKKELRTEEDSTLI